jgi:hypothetical protein
MRALPVLFIFVLAWMELIAHHLVTLHVFVEFSLHTFPIVKADIVHPSTHRQ